MIGRARRWLGVARATGLHRRGHGRFVYQQLVGRGRNDRRRAPDREHLLAAAAWLERAQDASGDGGVSGRYRLDTGWSSSYPETTGYIIPTFLELAAEIGEPRFRERAARAAEFLLRLQLTDGAFPGLEVAMNTTEPSPFNTAQILHGLVAWHGATREPRALEAARRAADWLLRVQDPDGAFRKHFYYGLATTYSAHLSCWIAEAGRHADEPRYLRSAERHLDWVLSRQDPVTGWFDLCGFGEEEHRDRTAFTHTIAYTIWGVLHGSEILGRKDGIAAAARAAEAVARRLELSRGLPGILDHRWRPRARFVCLTGNAQMALIWLRLHALEGDPRLLSAALGALDEVRRAQPLDNPDPGIRGGIPGSDPCWGEYISNRIPNWAAKFFIDALLAKERALAGLGQRARGRWEVPADVPRKLPDAGAPSERPALVTVMYTNPRSHKIEQMASAWSAWGFKPDLVVVEREREPSFLTRLGGKIREDGFRSLVDRLRPGRPAIDEPPPAAAASGSASCDPLAYCRANGIPSLTTDDVNAPETLERIGRLAPDLAIHAGAGILRKKLLELPRLGTLNAHMGLLPRYRGMNVAEWARFNGDPVGCTVHLIARGIDTGAILCVRPIDTNGIRTIAALRDAVDRAQVELLGATLQFSLQAGRLPPARPQRLDEGVQYFRMHPELTRVLVAELRQRS